MPLSTVSSFQKELGAIAPTYLSTLVSGYPTPPRPGYALTTPGQTLALAFRLAQLINEKVDNIWIVFVTVFLMLYVLSLLTQFIKKLETSMGTVAKTRWETATISGAVRCAAPCRVRPSPLILVPASRRCCGYDVSGLWWSSHKTC